MCEMCMRALMCGVLLCLAAGAAAPAKAQTSPTGPLVVFNAGSLARPFNDLLRAFKAKHSGVVPAQENSGSLEAARKLTELGKIPDVIGVADYGVIPKLLIPQHATWFATFARNSMVLIYTDHRQVPARSTAGTGGRSCSGPAYGSGQPGSGAGSQRLPHSDGVSAR